MRSDLLRYYEHELSCLRQLGVEFAQKYPKIASRLELEPAKCEDPHVERLIEAFAFIAARIHLKLDDEFPLITESLLEVLYPDFLRPLPSMSIAEFELDSDSGAITSGIEIQRGAKLYSKPVNGVPCKFRTAYDLKLWPVKVASAEWCEPERLPRGISHPDCNGAIRIHLRGPLGVPLSTLNPGELRFFLDGESALVHTLYELLHSNLLRAAIYSKNHAVLPPGAVTPVGFEPGEGVLPYSQRSFCGYRLLQEYFAFPEKFLFFDLKGCAGAWSPAGAQDSAELYFLFSVPGGADRINRLRLGMGSRVFRLNCTPIINLFEQSCEPIPVDQKDYEYPVVPDVRRQTAVEIHSIDRVTLATRESNDLIECEPFYSPRAGSHSSNIKDTCYWTAWRRPSNRTQDAGSDIFLSFTGGSKGEPVLWNGVVTVRATCSNRDLPSRLPFGNAEGDFELDGSARVQRILALRKPTAALRPPDGAKSLWNLISHLSLNYLSLVQEGTFALQNLLRLCDYSRTVSSQRAIEGIHRIESQPHFAGLLSENGLTFVRGTRVDLTLDEEQFVGGGVYLFSAVLERFFASYCSLNSFSQLRVRVQQRKELLREWQPRAGQRILL
jgi:type VI secretion system protein ImpG